MKILPLLAGFAALALPVPAISGDVNDSSQRRQAMDIVVNGDLDGALAMLDQALETETDRLEKTRLLLTRARLLQQRGRAADLIEAEANINEALRLWPENRRADPSERGNGNGVARAARGEPSQRRSRRSSGSDATVSQNDF